MLNTLHDRHSQHHPERQSLSQRRALPQNNTFAMKRGRNASLQGLTWLVVLGLLLISLPVLAAPALSMPSDRETGGDLAYYELQYELYRPTGECTLVGDMRQVNGAVVRVQQPVLLGDLSTGNHPMQVDERQVSFNPIWFREVELVRDAEPVPSSSSSSVSQLVQQRERDARSTLLSLYILSKQGVDELLPELLDVANGRDLPDGRKPSQACRSWVGMSSTALKIQSSAVGLDDYMMSEPTGSEVPEGMELIPLRVSGSVARRVNLAFFGDGYTLAERDKFIADVRRLADEIVDDGTFRSTAPLFNFWAIFVPSVESGVGSNGVPKDTPFGLYRDGHELRGLYAAHRKRARAACRAVRDGLFGDDGGCDYMALVGNTQLYGGLGGEFTITTASTLNGALVLRHEIGHSLIDVGEEYEGGFAYFGVNSSPNYTDVKWAHWLTAPERAPRSEDAATPLQAYPWFDLEKSDWSTTFETEGRERYPRSMLRFSIAGLTSADQMIVRLDGEVVPWSIPHDWQGFVDRAWIEVPQPVNGGLPAGEHTLSFKLNASTVVSQQGTDEVVRQICSVEVSEYGRDDVFERREDFIGAFPTRSMDGTITYRPTNEHCLMRMVGTPRLCSVCQEGLWNQLVRRTGVVDGVFVNDTGSRVNFGIVTVALAQFRKDRHANLDLPSESFSVEWKYGGRDGVDRPELANQTSLDFPIDEARGWWWAVVTLHSEEVRRWDSTGGLWAVNRWEGGVFI